MKTALILALAAAFPSIQSASAESFQFTFTDGGLTATGTLDGTLVSPNYYQMEGIGGIREYEITSGSINVQGTPSAVILNEDPSAQFVTGTGTLIPCGNGPMGCHYSYFEFFTDQLFLPSDPQSVGDLLFSLNEVCQAVMPGCTYFQIFSLGGYYNGFAETLSLNTPPYNPGFNDESGQFYTPEPSALLMVGSALLVLTFRFRKGRKLLGTQK